MRYGDDEPTKTDVAYIVAGIVLFFAALALAQTCGCSGVDACDDRCMVIGDYLRECGGADELICIDRQADEHEANFAEQHLEVGSESCGSASQWVGDCRDLWDAYKEAWPEDVEFALRACEHDLDELFGDGSCEERREFTIGWW